MRRPCFVGNWNVAAPIRTKRVTGIALKSGKVRSDKPVDAISRGSRLRTETKFPVGTIRRVTIRLERRRAAFTTDCSSPRDCSSLPLAAAAEGVLALEPRPRFFDHFGGDVLVDGDALGRPRRDEGVGRRLELLAELVTGGTRVAAPVLAAVAHGELLTLAPFGTGDGVVARGVSRLITIASGLDPHGLGVPEVHWMRRSGDYQAAARGFASGTPDGLAAWLVLSSEALHAGAREALSIAQAASS